MRRYIVILLLLFPFLVTAQDYWQKVDYDFETGVNKITFGMDARSFLTLSDNNDIHYFKRYDTLPTLFQCNINQDSITDFCLTHDKSIYFITDSKKLFYKPDLTEEDTLPLAIRMTLFFDQHANLTITSIIKGAVEKRMPITLEMTKDELEKEQ